MLPTTLIIEIVCLVLALVYLKRRNAGWYWYFVPFMAFIVVAEGAGYIMAAFFRTRNHWIYNIEMLGEIFFIPWLFYRIFRETGIKKTGMLIAGFSILLIAFFVETFYRKFFNYNSSTYVLMSAVFIIYAGVYFYGLLRMPEPVDMGRVSPLWISAGIFLFYFAGTAVNVFFKEVMQLNLASGIPLRLIIFTVLNAILYGCWSYAFRCRHLQTISFSK